MKTVCMSLAWLGLLIMPLRAQSNLPISYGDDGIDVVCPDGTVMTNGVEVVLLALKPGFTFRATALGINGFDPRMAVLPGDGKSMCSDDSPGALDYMADLPTTGIISRSNLNAQLEFQQVSGEPEYLVSIVVTGSGEAEQGEFLLVLEGLALTAADGVADPVIISVTPGMQASTVPLTVYMIGQRPQLDPFIFMMNMAGDNFLVNSAGEPMSCADAFESDCTGDPGDLDQSSVTLAGQMVVADKRDAAIRLELGQEELAEDPGLNYRQFRLSSLDVGSGGKYLLAVHAGVARRVRDGIQPGLSALSESAEIRSVRPINRFPEGIAVNCPGDGPDVHEGIEFQARLSADAYTVTVIGLDGFDPVLAVYDLQGYTLCNDDHPAAAQYGAQLPTTGVVESRESSAQITFNHSDTGLLDVRFAVGSANGTGGQFILILEGQAITTRDGTGDWYSVLVTPGMMASGVPLSVYMIAGTEKLDPFLVRVNMDRTVFRVKGREVWCDDAGISPCWGRSQQLIGSFVGRTTRGQYAPLEGDEFDAALSMALDDFSATVVNPDRNRVNLMMTSADEQTFGPYVAAFHAGVQPSGAGK